MKTNNYCTFYIVRHGQTDWNAKGIIQGHSDIELNSEGKRQAEDTSKVLRDIHFDEVYSSDLLRTKQTAEILLLEKKLAIQTSKSLRERAFGQYEGMEHHTFNQEIKELLEEYTRLSKEQQWKFKFSHEYESHDEVSTRFITFLREVAVANPQKTVLIVTHHGAISTFLVKVGFIQTAFPHLISISNSGFIKVKSDGVDFIVQDTKGVKV